MKILIVDDDAGCRGMLLRHLNERHELSLLTNGRNALALLADEDHGFDLILLDLEMPRLDGNELMKVLNECEHLHHRFIIMSGMPDTDHINGFPNVLAILRKPFKLSALDAVLNGIPSAA